jgi:hypothetical protein
MFERAAKRQPDLVTLGTTQALLDGRFDDAERLAASILGSVDPASANFAASAAQIAASWSLIGRDEDLLAALDGFPSQQEGQRVLVALVRCSTFARRGERHPAYDDFVDAGFASLPKNHFRPGSLWHAGLTAAWLRDPQAAALLEPLIAPYRSQLLMYEPGCALPFGPADFVHGMLLQVLGRNDDAIRCYEDAAELCARGRLIAFDAMNAHRLAAALLERDAPGDRARARDLATSSLERATAMGLQRDIRFAQAVLDDLALLG